jgi:stage V sporulation protein D (sporulation-specific penicillin-binding protein)
MVPKKKVRTKNTRFASLAGGRHWRIYALVFFVFSGAFVIFVRLYVLQVAAHDEYERMAENQHNLSQEIDPERGTIYLMDSPDPYPLAVNRQASLVYVVPKEVQEPDRLIREFERILQVSGETVEEKLGQKDDPFEVVKRRLSDQEVEQVRNLHLKGVYFLPDPYRYYPGGELASQVVGFVGYQGERFGGRYGLEAYWEERLHGNSGSVVQEKDAGGRWIPISDREFKPAENGESLVLTISREIQYEVEKILRETIEEHQADGGTIIVMEAQTGKLLAMASAPQFNPNEYSKADVALFMNPAVSLPYEPGSIMKTITVAIGLEEGKIEPESTFVDTGQVSVGGFNIRNAEDKVYGLQTMTQALEESINTGMIHIEKLVGNKRFADYFRRFGFGEKTGVELPAELAGNIRNLNDLKGDIQFFTASFGQGVTVTPLQMVTAYAALANGGKLMKPQIVEKVFYPDGEAEEIRPQEVRRVVSEATSEKIGRMLRSVVVNGHGKRADVPGYLVGGKTGTAQVASQNTKGYEDGAAIGSFVGYAPLNDPRFVVLVKVVNPKGVQWAESTAAPAFGKVMKFLL